MNTQARDVDIQGILRERAERLARAREDVVQDTVSVFGFRVGGELHALPLEAVDEILPIAGLAPLPGVPRSVLGVIQARAQVLVVVELRALLGLSGGGMSDLAQVVVMHTPGGMLGLGAEQVDGRLELPRAMLTAAEKGPFLWRSADRRAVLDPEWFRDRVDGA
jgi:purine-binding chemotaxis protein CheW